MYVRDKVVKGRTYYQLVEGYRDGDKVRHKTLASLGTASTLTEARANLKRKVARLRRHLPLVTPDATLFPRFAREAAALQAQLDKLTQLMARLEALDKAGGGQRGRGAGAAAAGERAAP
jgi:hypothetical protein